MILYFVVFIILVIIICCAVSLLRLSYFNKKVRAYTGSHDHRIIVNQPTETQFIGIDNNNQELTYISAKQQVSFSPGQIADVKITEKEQFDDEGDSVGFNIILIITLQNHQTGSIKIKGRYAAQRDSKFYNMDMAFATSIEKAINDIRKA